MGWREEGENVISWRWGGGLDTLLVLRTYIQFAYELCSIIEIT